MKINKKLLFTLIGTPVVAATVTLPIYSCSLDEILSKIPGWEEMKSKLNSLVSNLDWQSIFNTSQMSSSAFLTYFNDSTNRSKVLETLSSNSYFKELSNWVTFDFGTATIDSTSGDVKIPFTAKTKIGDLQVISLEFSIPKDKFKTTN